jgi:uncharacterized membrane protein YcaP (DUF421 family)
MDSVLRATAIYFFVWLLFRIAGKRTLSDATSFDFVLLLVIGESTQQALIGDDLSVTTALTLILTLIGLDIAMSFLKQRHPRLDRIMEGVPLIIVQDGKTLPERMNKARIDEADILEAARRLQGLERMDQIKFAVLENSGGITIIPR